MTESEAIKIFNDLLDVPCEMLIKYDSVINSEKKQALVRLKTAEEIAIKALEKQIPKKPHKNFENFSGVWCSCGKYLGKGYFVDKPSYCPDCGQKIDWE